MIKLEMPHRTVDIKNKLSEVSIGLNDKLQEIENGTYEFNIDKLFLEIKSLSDLTDDEIWDNIDNDSLNDIFEHLELFKPVKFDEIKNTFEFDGVKYSAKEILDFKMTMKEMKFLEMAIKKSGSKYQAGFAAIIFKEVDEDGKVIGGLTDEDINRRATIFKDHMTMDIIYPYLIKLGASFHSLNDKVTQ